MPAVCQSVYIVPFIPPVMMSIIVKVMTTLQSWSHWIVCMWIHATKAA